jgi:hypothetical protein
MKYPAPLVTWLRSACLEKLMPWDEYGIWSTDVLIKSFGPRKYVELKLTSDDVYNKR